LVDPLGRTNAGATYNVYGKTTSPSGTPTSSVSVSPSLSSSLTPTSSLSIGARQG
jgi:hypothetical protein